MKRILLPAFVAAACFTSTAHAQGVRFGLKAGTSLTSFVGKDADGFNYKFGFHGGALAELGITDNFAVQPEVLYSMKGARDQLYGSNDEAKTNLSYIDIPVLLKVKAAGLFFEGGPQIGFNVAAKSKIGSNSIDYKSSFQTIDFGYAAGLGYQAASGPLIGLRYNGGLSSIPKNAGPLKVRNSAFQLYIGYLFGG